MYLKTTYEKMSVAKTAIGDAVSAGRCFHSDYLSICRRANAAIPPKLPQWAHRYLRGYADAKIDSLWRETDFRYQLPNGHWTPARALSDLVLHYVAFNKCPAAHFWAGTDRPFTTPEIIG